MTRQTSFVISHDRKTKLCKMTIKPNRPKGPPLNALRAFEAAARLESFIAAADELCVTPGAVSQHIKTVEAWAGEALFRRNPHGVSLTQKGRAVASDLTQAFDILAAATQNLRNIGPNPDIHIAALPSVAQLWLPRRLGLLRKMRPDLNFSVTAMETPPSLQRELFDMAIFFTDDDGHSDQIKLAEDTIYPVAGPDLADAVNFETVPLLHDQTWNQDWAMWSDATQISAGDTKRGARFSLYGLAVEEAKAGAGALMGHHVLVADAIKAGQLHRLSDASCSTGQSLVIQLPDPAHRRAVVEDIAQLLADRR